LNLKVDHKVTTEQEYSYQLHSDYDDSTLEDGLSLLGSHLDGLEVFRVLALGPVLHLEWIDQRHQSKIVNTFCEYEFLGCL